MTPSRNDSRDVIFLDGPYDRQLLQVSRAHASHLMVAQYDASTWNDLASAPPAKFLYEIHKLNMFGYILDVAIEEGTRLTDAHGLRVVKLLVDSMRSVSAL